MSSVDVQTVIFAAFTSAVSIGDRDMSHQLGKYGDQYNGSVEKKIYQ